MAECKFCKQGVLDTDSEKEATDLCSCFGAEQLRKRKKAAEEAKMHIQKLFGEGCAKNGLVPLSADVITALKSVCDLFASGDVATLTLTVPAICVIKISQSGNAIKVTRSEVRKYETVAGEK